jgi:hypothetical protein
VYTWDNAGLSTENNGIRIVFGKPCRGTKELRGIIAVDVRQRSVADLTEQRASGRRGNLRTQPS